jgi:ketosteroid isomerase-like protein
MKRMGLGVCLVVLVSAVPILAQTGEKPKGETMEQELFKIELEWGKADVKADVAFLNGVLADDWTWTDPDGNVFTKARSLAMMKSGEDIISSCVSDNMEARIHGDAAVVTGHNTVRETMKGKDISGQYNWTDFFVKRNGRWLCLASIGSKVPQK